MTLAEYIVLDAGRDGHPAEINVLAMIRAICRRGAQSRLTGAGAGQMLSRALVKFGQQRHLVSLSRQKYIGITMGLPARFVYPHALYARMVLYCFDCWEPQFDEWERFLRRNAFLQVFFSARDAAAELARRLPDQRIAWLPEAIRDRRIGWSRSTCWIARAS